MKIEFTYTEGKADFVAHGVNTAEGVKTTEKLINNIVNTVGAITVQINPVPDPVAVEKATVNGASEPSVKRFAIAGDKFGENPIGAFVYHSDYATLLKSYRDLDELTAKRIVKLSDELASMTENRDQYRNEYLRRCEQLENVERELTEYKVANTGLLNRIDEQREALTKLQDERDDEAKSSEYYRGLNNYWFNAHQRLERHVKRMQQMATAFIEPNKYTDRYLSTYADGSPGEKTAFIKDMLYMLDGPEQREAMSAVGVPRDHIELVKLNEELQAANGRLTIELANAQQRAANPGLSDDFKLYKPVMKGGTVAPPVAGMTPSADGEWVKFADFKGLYAQLIELREAAKEREPVMTINTVGDITQTDVFEHAPVGSEPEGKAVFECTFEWARDNWDLMVDQYLYNSLHKADAPSGYVKVVMTA